VDPNHSPIPGPPNTIVWSQNSFFILGERPCSKVIHAEILAPGIKRFVIEAPRRARKHQPGQFVILRIYEEGERIPVTIENSDLERGTINLVVQARREDNSRGVSIRS